MYIFSLSLYIGVFAVLSKCISIFLTQRRRLQESERHGCAPPPTVSGSDPLGIMSVIAAARANREGRSPIWFMELMDKISPNTLTVRGMVLDTEIIITRDPSLVQFILQTEANKWDIGPQRREIWSPLLGDAIFTAQGDAWKHSRQLVRPQFSRDRVSDLDLEERHVQALFARHELQSTQDGWTGKVDLAPLFYNLTLDVSTEFLYGKSVHSQEAGNTASPNPIQSTEDTDFRTFGRHLDAGKETLFMKGIAGRWNGFVKGRNFDYHRDEVHRMVDKFVEGCLRQTQDEKRPELDSEKKPFSLLDELAKVNQDPVQLRHETLQVLNAGRDTTGSLLGWIFYFLARNPDVYSKLRSIILSDFGPSGSEISFQSLRSCKYLQYVIDESLRVGAPVPLNDRTCNQDTILPRGGGPDGTQPMFLPAGSRVLVSTYAMQYRKDIWGEDAEKFRPERWEGRRAGWEFIPFGGGPRKCIGQQFSLTETSYIIIRFLQKYDQIENLEKPGPVLYHHTVTNRSMNGVQVRLHKADPLSIV
ncbi:uncharacterized protein EAE98_011192 [Botrytis deweyae]|uniref:Cytochrome P450 n=1 Tax=Botrytis deweyae TaxID=2478750 RepID=A0ABQ7I6V0_9HELO|nr:uncharacterized protein EAE98_011192 [Botrytis deweyae]KAF7915326.1 hypothetical protein EAE98_011192 [Botrytis deweyae]